MDKIAIIGRMASGKTYLGKLLNEKLFNNEALISAFAEPMKEIESNRELLINYLYKGNSLYMNDDFMNTLEKYDSELLMGEKHRKQYQFIGEFFKRAYGQNFWAKKFFIDFENYCNVMKPISKLPNALIIDDTRFMIEYETIKQQKGEFIFFCIETPDELRLKLMKELKLGTPETLNDISETQVDDVIGKIKSNFYSNMFEFDSGRRITLGSSKEKPNAKLIKKYSDFIIKNY